MRRALFAFAAATAALTGGFVLNGLTVTDAEAQVAQRGSRSTEGRRDTDAEERSNRPRIQPLRRRAAAGPCPYVKILYEGARYVEMTEGRPSLQTVGYTGEIEGVVSDCGYQSDEPITVEMRTLFNLGRGPQAQGDARTYRYWIAVTERNSAVLAKEYFDLPVTFGGADRTQAEASQTIVIPRADATTSGGNFEVLIGFDVTPQMAEFNRSGSRFRPTAGQQTN